MKKRIFKIYKKHWQEEAVNKFFESLPFLSKKSWLQKEVLNLGS